MSDTPETDAAWNAAPTDDTEFANAGWAFARELERERNHAMEQRLCECSFEDACRFAVERDALHEENRKLRELADALLAELDRTNPEPEKLKPDADGWIPHKPGDPMPCDPALIVSIKHNDGVVTETCPAVYWGCCHDKDSDWWTGKDCLEENLIVAWRPAE